MNSSYGYGARNNYKGECGTLNNDDNKQGLMGSLFSPATVFLHSTEIHGFGLQPTSIENVN